MRIGFVLMVWEILILLFGNLKLEGLMREMEKGSRRICQQILFGKTMIPKIIKHKYFNEIFSLSPNPFFLWKWLSSPPPPSLPLLYIPPSSFHPLFRSAITLRILSNSVCDRSKAAWSSGSFLVVLLVGLVVVGLVEVEGVGVFLVAFLVVFLVEAWGREGGGSSFSPSV